MMKIRCSNLLSWMSILLLWGCYGSNPQQPQGNPGPNEVWVQDDSFNPATLTVTKNTQVTWTHKGSHTHTITSTLFNETDFRPGEIFSFTFDSTAIGTNNYQCALHSNMNGTIIVN